MIHKLYFPTVVEGGGEKELVIDATFRKNKHYERCCVEVCSEVAPATNSLVIPSLVNMTKRDRDF